MQTFLNIFQILVGALLITVILLQQRGGGLSAVFGGEGNIYRTKRGFEKILFWGTVGLAILFLGTALLRIYL